METGRRIARARLVPAASTALGLANVVRGARFVPPKPVVCSNRDLVTARQAERRGVIRKKSVSRCAAALCARNNLSLSLHERRRTPTNPRVVETSGARRIFAGHLARRRAIKAMDRRNKWELALVWGFPALALLIFIVAKIIKWFF